MRLIESRVVLVAGQRPLAREAVPGLQRVGGSRILDHGGHPSAQALHHLVVHHFAPRRERLGRELGPPLGLQLGGQVATDLGPEVAHEIRLSPQREFHHRALEVRLPLLLPAGPQGLHPRGIGGRIGTLVHAGGRALQHIELPGVPGEIGYRLRGGGTGADDRHALVGQLVEHRVLRVATGIAVVPARGMEHRALELLDAGNPRQLGHVEHAAGHDDEARADLVAAIGAHPPAPDRFVPAQRGDQGVEQRPLGKAEFARDQPAVLMDLLAVGEALRRHVAGFFQQRQVAVGIVVALDAGIAVPVPDAAEIAGVVDIAEVRDSRNAEVIGGQYPAETPAQDGDVDLLGHRLARRHRLVRVGGVEVVELPGNPHILPLSRRVQALVALLPVFLAQRGDIDLVRRGHVGGLAVHFRPLSLCYFFGNSISAFAVDMTVPS